MPNCKICRSKFIARFSSFQKTCENPSCIIEWSKLTREKEAKKEHREWKSSTKEKLMTLSDYIQICQKVFNTYIRMRDKDLPCISCGTMANVQYAAGHFYHAHGYPNLRFHEDNVMKQCNKKCNGELSGNLLLYREGLIKRIGIERFEALEKLKHVPRHYTIPEVKELIQNYRNKIKQLER